MEYTVKEILNLYNLSSKEFKEKVKEYKIPAASDGKYKKNVLDKFFSRVEKDHSLGKVIAISNQKGGEGKTTISLFLSEALSKDSRVLLVDWDAQANATRLFTNEPGHSIFDCLEYRKKSQFKVSDIIMNISKNFDLVPSSIALANLNTPYEISDFELLKDALLPVLSSYDFIIIDCPPSLGLALENALIASDYVIVPVQTRAFSVQGLKDLHDTIEKIKRKANPGLELLGAVFNQFEGSRALAGLSENVKKYFPVFKTSIQRKESIPQAQAKRKMLSSSDKETYKSFLELAKEVKEKINV